MGLPRGGLVPPVILSHKLNLPLLQKISQNTLIVDDICDSGITLLEASDFGFQTAALALRYSSPYIPEFYSEKITDDKWLVFPWEKSDSKTIQDYLG